MSISASRSKWQTFKKALVTGASSGLGRILCQKLAEKNIPLIVTARKDLPPAEIAIEADLTKERHKILQVIEEQVPDLIINCAGFGAYGPAVEHSLDLLEVNANAAIEISLAAARALQKAKRPGIILNISSVASLIPMPYMALYGAAKASLTSFSKSFDFEMQPHGIRVLVSLPGPIDTPFALRASKGKFQKKAGLEAEWVAKRLLQQIEKEKNFEILDWKMRLIILLARCLPRLAARIIEKDLSERTSQ